MTWLTDSNGNKCSVEYFGTKEAAQTALDSLRDCENCINCSGCSGCSGKKGDGTAGDFHAPKVPVIPDIHKLIYDASDPSRRFNPCRFFDSNEDALADMKKLAEK